MSAGRVARTADRPANASAPVTSSPPSSAASGGRCSPATTSTPPGIFDAAGIAVLLVGDSASNNVFGHETTLPVTVDELLPLVRAVVRSTKRTLVVGDMPFGSYEEGPTQALRTAVRFMKEGGCHAVKLEGGRVCAPQIAAMTAAGIPVMAHVGFTPQREHTIGGYRVQGRGDAADEVLADALAVAEAGAFAVVLEMVPGELAKRITHELADPHGRHRRRPGLRRTGARVAGHGRAAQRPDAPVREAVRGSAHGALGGRHGVRGRGPRRDLPHRRTHPPLTTTRISGCTADRPLPARVGDANAGVRLVPPVDRDQVRGQRLDLSGVAQPTSVDTAHAGDAPGQRGHDAHRIPVVAEHQHVQVDPVHRRVGRAARRSRDGTPRRPATPAAATRSARPRCPPAPAADTAPSRRSRAG